MFSAHGLDMYVAKETRLIDKFGYFLCLILIHIYIYIYVYIYI